jgi:hypothetical protein
MFVRKKKNSSGSVSVQIIEKTHGKYKVVETIGCSKDKNEINKFFHLGEQKIKELEPNLFDAVEKEEKKHQFISLRNDQIVPIGDELFFGKIYDQICSKNILDGIKGIRYKDDKNFLFKSMVVSRLLYPGSKLYLIDYLNYFKKQDIDIEKIYRFLDTLYQDELKYRIEKSVFEYSLKKAGGDIVVSFYDVTTLHFESESEDDLRRIGFSKEGKLNRPQIQLGLFTTIEGYPLSFEVYDGKKFEGHTMVDVLIKFQKKFNIANKPIVVADRGMLNDKNIAILENNGYKYILGAKIKMMPKNLKEQISNLTFIDDNVTHQIDIAKTIKYKDDEDIKQELPINQRLILTYSTSRAKKDKYLRDKALQRLELKISQSSNLKKSDLKLSHYAKFLDLKDECNIQYKLNNNKIIEDEKLDGLKGYITNDTSLNHKTIINHYQNLWHIEKAFRISKTDLKIRPIYHRLETRIKAHILVSFVSYALYKEFEIKTHKIKKELQISHKIIRDIIKHIFAIQLDGKIHPLELSDIQQQFYDAISEN